MSPIDTILLPTTMSTSGSGAAQQRHRQFVSVLPHAPLPDGGGECGGTGIVIRGYVQLQGSFVPRRKTTATTTATTTTTTTDGRRDDDDAADGGDDGGDDDRRGASDPTTAAARRCACVDVGLIERTILANLRRRICCRRCPDWTKTGARTATAEWRQTKAAGVGAVDNGVGKQQPTIDGSVEGRWAAACKTSTMRRIAPPPLLLPLPGMCIQSIRKGGGRGGFEMEDSCRRLMSSCACDNGTYQST